MYGGISGRQLDTAIDNTRDNVLPRSLELERLHLGGDGRLAHILTQVPVFAFLDARDATFLCSTSHELAHLDVRLSIKSFWGKLLPPSSSFQTETLRQTRRYTLRMPIMQGIKTDIAETCSSMGLAGWIRWSSMHSPTEMQLECAVQGPASKLVGLEEMFRQHAVEKSGAAAEAVFVCEEMVAGKFPICLGFTVGKTPRRVIDIADAASLNVSGISDGSVSLEDQEHRLSSTLIFPRDLTEQMDDDRQSTATRSSNLQLQLDELQKQQKQQNHIQQQILHEIAQLREYLS